MGALKAMDTLSLFGGAGAILVVLATVWKFASSLFSASRHIADLHDLAMFHLRPAEDRKDGKTGMLDRLTIVEDTVASELTDNGGNSMKDRVGSVEAYVAELKGREGRATNRSTRTADAATPHGPNV